MLRPNLQLSGLENTLHSSQADSVHPSGEFGIWNGTVEYRYSVLEAIRCQAVEALQSLVNGGLEIGGILYGEKRGEMVRIPPTKSVDSSYLTCMRTRHCSRSRQFVSDTVTWLGHV